MDADAGDPLDVPERLAGYGLVNRLNNMRCAGTDLPAAVGAVALAGMIVFYDACHNNNPFSPVVMGLCRVLVYVTVGMCLVASQDAGRTKKNRLARLPFYGETPIF